MKAVAVRLPSRKESASLNYSRAPRAGKKSKPATVEEDGDTAWSRILNDPQPRPKLQAYAEKVLAEMKTGKHFPRLRLEDL
jgi:hypothetical protein